MAINDIGAPFVAIRGRGTASNPPNRFDPIEFVWDGDELDRMHAEGEEHNPQTKYFDDHTKTIIARNDSPDVGFGASVNAYRGCSHGCIYCFARPNHEYLGFSAGLDFETKIMVKRDAPDLLRKELMKKSYTPETIFMSGVTDCYQPIERKLQITRKCLHVLAEFRNPVGIITKNHLVTRDIDILQELAAHNAVSVNVSITTLDVKLQRLMEPRTSIPERRLIAVEKLAKAGIPVGIMVAPIIPGLTDEEMGDILQAGRDRGAEWASYVILRLPHGVAPLFEEWLGQHFPGRKEKVLNRVRSMRKGKLYDSTWGERGRGTGEFADQTAALFRLARKKAGYPEEARPHASTSAFRRPEVGGQFRLFE